MKTKGAAGPWLRPTTRVEKAFQEAQERAHRAGYELAQSQHLLLALAQEPQSFSTLLLGRLGVSVQDLDEKITRLEQALRPQDDDKAMAFPTETAWAANRSDMLVAARHEAQELGSKYVGTEHVLLGLIRAQDGLAGQALQDLGVTWERAHAALLSLPQG